MNRTEFCSVSHYSSGMKAHAVPRSSAVVYVKSRCVIKENGRRAANPYLWMPPKKWDEDYTRDIHTEDPGGDYERYTNYAMVNDEDVALDLCWYAQNKPDLVSEDGMGLGFGGGVYEISGFDPITGVATRKKTGELCLVTSPRLLWSEPEEIMSRTGLTNYHNALDCYTFNPSHKMAKALAYAKAHMMG